MNEDQQQQQLAVAARAPESTVTITEAIPSFSSVAAKAKPIAVIQSMNYLFR